MGNCVRAQRPAIASVEDDGFWMALEQESSGHLEQESSGHHGEQQEDEYCRQFLADTTAGAGSSEIKIRISKKQLEALLRRRADDDDDDGSKDQLRLLVSDLVSSAKSGKLHEQEDRHWRPRLHSIPELPE